MFLIRLLPAALALGLSLLALPGWAQPKYTPLVPAMRPAPDGQPGTVPNYGGLLTTVQNEVKQWADIRCQESLKRQLTDKLEAARSAVSAKTTYVVVADITTRTDCRITTFRPARPGENPAVLHDPAQKLLVYTLEVYPWLTINGRRY